MEIERLTDTIVLQVIFCTDYVHVLYLCIKSLDVGCTKTANCDSLTWI